MQRIIAENRHVIDENTSMQRELMAAKEEIRRLGQMVPKLQADKEACLRELTQKGLKLEAELRGCEPLRIEVKQLRAEVQDLDTSPEELSAHVKGLRKEITRFKAENQLLPSMRADAEQLRKELADARRIFEFEKKANEEQVEQRRLMESSIVSMAAEIRQLGRHPTEKHRGYGNGGHGIPETGYPTAMALMIVHGGISNRKAVLGTDLFGKIAKIICHAHKLSMPYMLLANCKNVGRENCDYKLLVPMWFVDVAIWYLLQLIIGSMLFVGTNM